MLKIDFFILRPEEKLPELKFNPAKLSVHIWQFMHEGVAPEIIEESFSILSPREQRRARAFLFEKDRTSYILSNAFLRKLLYLYTGIPPQDIKYVHGTYGKPGLEHESLIKFNSSHSGHAILYGFTWENELGVDVEQIRPLRDSLLRIVDQQFTPKERNEFNLLPPHEQKAYFFQTWTRKEAYLKAKGTGLYGALQDIDFEFLGLHQNLRHGTVGRHSDPSSYRYVEFSPALNYTASLVIEADITGQ